MADPDYAPMDYAMEGAEPEQPGDEEDSDEVINEQADDLEEEEEEPEDSKETEEPEVRSFERVAAVTGSMAEHSHPCGACHAWCRMRLLGQKQRKIV